LQKCWLKIIPKLLGESGLNLLIIFAWIAVFSFLAIFRYVCFYEAESHFIYIDGTKLVRPYSSFEGPSFQEIDLGILFLSGLIGGFLLKDFEKVLFGLIKAGFLSFLTDVVYASFFIWFALGFKEFAAVNFFIALEWTVFYAVLNFVRILPMGLIPLFLGAIITCFVLA
jgi:hypothetical protein